MDNNIENKNSLKMSFILAAAGNSTRMGSTTSKVLLPLAGKNALIWSLEVLSSSPQIGEVIIVLRPEDKEQIEEQIEKISSCFDLPIRTIFGGATRAAGIKKALDLCDYPLVGIHDAARPLLHYEDLQAVLEQAEKYPQTGVILAAAAVDTLHGIDDFGCLLDTIDRNTLVCAMTPQIFPVGLLRQAYAAAQAEQATDEAALFLRAQGKVRYVLAKHDNFKLTVAEDMVKAEAVLAQRKGFTATCGLGWDIHRLIPVDKETEGLVLGGIFIPYEKKFLAHSDGDVLLHAVIDGMLGAAALPDIGRQFPDTDPAYQGISSQILLQRCRELLQQVGKQVHNIDCVIIAQAPKLAPWVDKIAANIENLLELPQGAVSVKAKTAEGLGQLGAAAAIAAQAIVSMRPAVQEG